MLSSVDVSNMQGGFIKLPLTDPTSGIVVKSIDGLDPVKATLVSSSFANLDGEQYHSSKRDTRNIVLTLGLDPQFTTMGVRELRQLFYKVCMPKSMVTLTFHDTNDLPVQIDGRVESMETPLFSADPTVQISILCYNPDFIDPIPVTLSGSASDTSGEVYINYVGTVDTGLLLAVSPTGSDSGTFAGILRSPGNDNQQTYFSSQVPVDSVLTISSVPGNKYAYLRTAAGYQESALQDVDPASAWLTLHPGDNYFLLDYPSTPALPWEIQYFNRYGGL